MNTIFIYIAFLLFQQISKKYIKENTCVILTFLTIAIKRIVLSYNILYKNTPIIVMKCENIRLNINNLHLDNRQIAISLHCECEENHT
ncbi:MAG: ATP-dependent helicase/DNAse subunit B [Saprospiraceae bacterium]|jgi:ATP-dependent helicase/DNAse subunit B